MSGHVRSSELDPIGAALVAASAKETIGPITELIKKIGADAYNSLTSRFEGCFQGHVEATFARCSKMKNILYRDQSIDFLSQYVNVIFSLSGREISDSEVLSEIIDRKPVLICGTAGAGKTMFMRWSALALIKGIESYGRVPLYLEMRYFEDEFEKESLEKYVYKKTSATDDASSFSQFLSGLKSGLFVVLLDAIDEIKPSLRDRVVTKVLDFLHEYPLCGIVLSSRFDDKLESIQEFSVLRTMPMNENQIVHVIENLEYDNQIKSKLIEKLNGGLYEQLKEFLSNPLLATIMLLTFDHSADIPTKLTAFYQQAFEALYQRHDAAKGAYKRDHYAGLPIDRFQTIFSTLCFQTYINYKFRFSDGDLLLAFRGACKYNQEEVDPQLLIRDSMESICLIQRDGLDNIFSHRSFQDYFCALFVARYREAGVGGLIEALASMENRSNVLKMLYELAPEVFEYEWVLPTLKKFLSAFGKIRLDTASGLSRIFSGMYDSVDVNVKSHRVQIVSWSARSPASKRPEWEWMSIIYGATEGKIRLYGSTFSTKIWDDLDQFLETVPDDVRPAKDLIVGRIQMDSEDNEHRHIKLMPSDANWLIYSNLPEIFDGIRLSIRRYYREITQRRKNRRVKVDSLLEKSSRINSPSFGRRSR
ncbi:MAG: NACHT domain-containing protein [Puia sp.]|nr:NACHT domain-containing protein [Puia sp.]